MIFILIFVENWLSFDAINKFSVWLRTGSNPPDTGKFIDSFENVKKKINQYKIKEFMLEKKYSTKNDSSAKCN